MARHRTTMNNWSGDGTTWLWYEGREDELETMKQDACSKWPTTVECGCPEIVTRQNGRESIFYMAFVFQKSDEAMLFKLSQA